MLLLQIITTSIRVQRSADGCAASSDNTLANRNNTGARAESSRSENFRLLMFARTRSVFARSIQPKVLCRARTQAAPGAGTRTRAPTFQLKFSTERSVCGEQVARRHLCVFVPGCMWSFRHYRSINIAPASRSPARSLALAVARDARCLHVFKIKSRCPCVCAPQHFLISLFSVLILCRILCCYSDRISCCLCRSSPFDNRSSAFSRLFRVFAAWKLFRFSWVWNIAQARGSFRCVRRDLVLSAFTVHPKKGKNERKIFWRIRVEKSVWGGGQNRKFA